MKKEDEIVIPVSKSEYEFLMKHVRATNSRPIEQWILDGQALEKKKQAVRKKTQIAVKEGRLKKKPCEVCGTIKVEAHHEDYEQPLKVRWFCRKHHEIVHHKIDTRVNGNKLS